MDTEVNDLEHIKQIELGVDAAFRGLLTDYHKTLSERIISAIAVWIPPEHLEDVLNDIRYARGTVNTLIREDEERNRFEKS